MNKYDHGKDLSFFIANQDELVEKYNGKILLIHNQEVFDAYESNLQAYQNGIEKYGEGNFSIQRCIAGEEAYTWIRNGIIVIPVLKQSGLLDPELDDFDEYYEVRD